MPPSRLAAIVNMVPKAGTVADIGCDHGKIAGMLLGGGKAKRVICSDISAKSLDKARRLISVSGLDEHVSLREGDGLGALDAFEADAAVIAGMGGELIAKILEKGKDKAPETLVMSCNTAPEALRKWLCGNGYSIEDEEMVFENAHFYTVIRAKKGVSRQQSEIELEFGPVLLKKKPEALIRFVEKKIEKTQKCRAKITESDSLKKDELLYELDKKLRKYAEVMKCL